MMLEVCSHGDGNGRASPSRRANPVCEPSLRCTEADVRTDATNRSGGRSPLTADAPFLWACLSLAETPSAVSCGVIHCVSQGRFRNSGSDQD